MLLFVIGIVDLSYAFEKGDGIVYVDELPPIYSQYTSKRIEIKHLQSVILNEYFLTDSSVTTTAGERLFTPMPDGLRVNEPGLYRVTFFQTVGTLDPESQLMLFLDVISSLAGRSQVHMQESNMTRQNGGVIQFTQITRMNKGDKLRLNLQAYRNDAIVLNGSNVSSFVVEVIK